MFAKDAREGQTVTLKLNIRESDYHDFELWSGTIGTIESFVGTEVRVRFEFEHNGRDWVDFAHIERDELADYFEEFEEDPEEN